MAQIDGPVDANGAVRVAQPLNSLHSGFGQLAFVKSPSQSRVARVNPEGELRVAVNTRLFDSNFNGPAAGPLLNNQWNQQGTTMASVVNAGFLRLNSAVITTINTGISITSWQQFGIHDQATLKLGALVRHANGGISNKQVDLGFGYYDIAAAQNAPMNEFIGFRWTQAGALLGVLEYSAGSAATTVTVNINGGNVYSENDSHNYEMFIDNNTGVDFYVDGVFQANIPPQNDSPGLIKSSGYPAIIRMYNGASAPAFAPVFDIGSLTVSRLGPTNNEERSILQVKQGRHSSNPQAGTQIANGNTASVLGSGALPTVLVPSNTVSGLVGLGGYGRATLTGVVLAPHTNLIMNSFQNPLLPELSGAAANGRSLIITDIMISPLIVSVLIAGGGFTASWFVAIGGTVLSLATADSVGSTTPGAKSAKIIPLPIFDTLAAAAALGTIATRVGETGRISLQTPLVIAPGEHIHVGLRTLFVTAAVTAGAVDFGIGFSGFWD